MANYYATARSNYFCVKNRAAFERWAGEAGLQVLPNENHTDKVMIAPAPEGEGSWPGQRFDRKTGQWMEFDLCQELGVHLVRGEIAVLMEVGHEKLRYLSGVAVAVASQGEVERLDLNEIYSRAAMKTGVSAESISKAKY